MHQNRTQNFLQEVIFEDWGQGIKDLDTFRQYGQYGKTTREQDTIGRKGLGKLSLRLNDEVDFLTNNGKTDMKISMTPKGFVVNHDERGHYLNHQGTRIVILKSSRELPAIDELAWYLKKYFGLRIAKGARNYP